jgi:hypothetical protein
VAHAVKAPASRREALRSNPSASQNKEREITILILNIYTYIFPDGKVIIYKNDFPIWGLWILDLV